MDKRSIYPSIASRARQDEMEMAHKAGPRNRHGCALGINYEFAGSFARTYLCVLYVPRISLHFVLCLVPWCNSGQERMTTSRSLKAMIVEPLGGSNNEIRREGI